jgi:hypothetical protein
MEPAGVNEPAPIAVGVGPAGTVAVIDGAKVGLGDEGRAVGVPLGIDVAWPPEQADTASTMRAETTVVPARRWPVRTEPRFRPGPLINSLPILPTQWQLEPASPGP